MLSQPQSHCAAESLRQWKNCNYAIGKWTRDHHACSAARQTTASPRVGTIMLASKENLLNSWYFHDFLTLILPMWRIWWDPNNASKWQMGFNLAFKGLMCSQRPLRFAAVAVPTSADLRVTSRDAVRAREISWPRNSVQAMAHGRLLANKWLRDFNRLE